MLHSRLGNLTVINTTSESVKLSWTLQNGSFDAFLIVATDYTGLYGPLEMSLNGDIRSTEVTGLLDSTLYKVYLYGFVGHWRSDSLNTEATTGIVFIHNISPLQPFFSSSSNFQCV